MESSDEAELILFPIGPSTVIGRAVALRVLFCRSLRELIRRALGQLGQWKRAALVGIGWFLSVFNPRRPSVMLAAFLGVGYILRRAKSESGKAERAFRRKFWNNMMKTALTYEEWAHAASMLEKEEGRRRKDSDLYDEELVRAKLNELRLRRLEAGVEDILFCLRADLVRNLGNMCNPELHKGRLSTPPLIQEYINEVRYHLRAICETDSGEFSFEEKIAFIHETRHAFGRTALLLSGGAALGAFHLGVVRTLIEHRLLPRIVAGASVGSILCSFAATRTWPELQSFFDDPTPPMHFFESMGSIFATAHRLLTRGAVQEIGQLQRKMRQLIGDLTFQEAYDLSGRVLGISVCSPRRHEPPRCLNYLTSPHVVIWSAVTASCAFPGLFEAQELMAKDRQGRLVPYHTLSQVGPEEPGIAKRQWRDGSLESDLPMMQLKELFNVNHFIVSQANPHIAPLLRLKELVRVYGGDFAAKLAHLAEMEVKHRCNQVLEMGFRMYGLAKLFAQDWEGDVTIVMPATFAQFAKLIQNPTPSELRKAVMQGRRCTWAKLSAIQANCGIELMLDECVAELNRRRKAQREAERVVAQSSGIQHRSSATKRIPSWNCLARETSWGSLSLDDDGGMEATLQQPGGPWGGPTVRRLRPSRHNCDGSDSDSGTEEFNNLSWTKAGGPLMRTASAAKFLMSLESDADSGTTAALAAAPKDVEGPLLSPGVSPGSHQVNSGRLGRANSWDMRSSSINGLKRSNNKIWEGLKCEDADDEAFALSLQGGMRKSASATMVSASAHLLDESGKRSSSSGAEAAAAAALVAACECSDLAKGLEHQQQQQQSEQESKSRDSEQPGSGSEESTPKSAGSAGSASGSGRLTMERRTRSLDKSAFGSFIVKYVELPDGQNQDSAEAAAATAAVAEPISSSSPRSASVS